MIATVSTRIWGRRELLSHLTVRNLRAQYKQSALGYAWLVLNPLTQLATFVFIFSTVMNTPSQGEPFLLFLAVGLFPWTFFALATGSATESISAAGAFVSAVYFPRELLVLSSVLIRVVDLAVSMLILLALFAVYEEPVTWSVLWVPLIFALQFLFTVGLAMPLAALNLFFHDVRYLVGVVLNLWFFFTPSLLRPGHRAREVPLAL